MDHASTIRGPASNLSIFVFLLAVGTLIHKTQLWEGLGEPFGILTTVLCCALLFKPSSTRLIILFAIATLWEAWWYSPFYFLNHMVYVAFVCVAAIGAVIAAYVKDRRVPETADALEPVLFPLARAGVYAMFALVVLGKLNFGFFHPINGCALNHFTVLQARLGVSLDLTSPVLTVGLPLLTLMTEGGIPILLFFKRTRPLAFFLAAGFHYVMAVNGYQGFSAFTLCLYVPFMPTDLHKSVARAWENAQQRYNGRLWRQVILWSIVVFSAAATVGEATDRTYQMTRAGKLWYLVVAPIAYLAYVRATTGGRVQSPTAWPTGTPRGFWQIAILAIFIVQSLSPYFGYRTEAAFTMFSNLQTEEGHWNHLFLPEWLRVGGYQNSLVTIRDISDYEPVRPWERDQLPYMFKQGLRVTRFELKRQISVHCRAGDGPIRLSYTVDGRDVDLVDACQDPDLSKGNGYFLEKIMWFRPIGLKEECVH
jgi:hypothetical protein